MPFRPTAQHRRNIFGVVLPLTEAVRQLYGEREDRSIPIGAFYTINIDRQAWLSLGGIWYAARDNSKLSKRQINQAVVDNFIEAIKTGNQILLLGKSQISWEQIPALLATQLPVPLR